MKTNIQSLGRPSSAAGAFKPILKKSLAISKAIKQKIPGKRFDNPLNTFKYLLIGFF